MPGNPLYHRFEKHLENIYEEAGTLFDHKDDAVLSLIASGLTMDEVAETFQGCIENRPGFPSRSWLYIWRDKGGEERKKRWKEAKQIAGHNVFEDVDELFEGPEPVSQAEVSYLKLQIQRANNRAKALNPEVYGDKQPETPEINLSVKELHLDALRSHGQMALPEEKDTEEIEEADYELLEES